MKLGAATGAIMYPGFATGAGTTDDTETVCGLEIGAGAPLEGPLSFFSTDGVLGVGTGTTAPGVGVAEGTGAGSREGDAGAGIRGRVYRKVPVTRV